MTTDNAFTGSIPEIYDQLLVPIIFHGHAVDLAKRVAKTCPRRVLETAAGTGVLTRALTEQLPANARIVATDLNQPMLDRARARKASNEQIEWKRADALALPFDNATFDAVACQFGVMFFPDKVQGFKEARRVLSRQGHFVFNTWDRISENEFADTVTEALQTLFPHDPPDFLVRIPHGYHDESLIEGHLRAAGFSEISIEAVRSTSKAASSQEASVAYCQGTPMRLEIEARDPMKLEEATQLVAEALAQRFGRGAIEGRISAIAVTAAW